MALDTESDLFVGFAPAFRAMNCQSEGDAGTGRSRLGKSSVAQSPTSSSGTGNEPATRDDSVTAPPVIEQVTADVLVVDDEADVRWTVAEILRSAGFSVAEAQDGEVALSLLNTRRYRMVLLDIRMPKRDGVSLIEAVGKVPPVIVHSAYSLDASERERLGSRVVDYLHKPVSPQKLLRAVEAVLGAGDRP